jgi:hypothetical protein
VTFKTNKQIARLNHEPGGFVFQTTPKHFSASIPNKKTHYLIISKPVYGTNAAGMRIPSGVWLFSNSAATIRGNANELPFSVCAS